MSKKVYTLVLFDMKRVTVKQPQDEQKKVEELNKICFSWFDRRSIDFTINLK